ncbi:uncharacterized protein RAG0_05746 [Rhynchosporium agropyri]|uniref:Methyltransferase n=2 Tax=Rhynchosporium TaxID=38037 RepID=A0A1E1MC89_RHYSE|nr:uncharacterized protein RAG0_05746 [Rhynchosporium agropyri]CZT46680.1 uncharacterized protein RSE6_07145 [Rhynchosporium secalis]
MTTTKPLAIGLESLKADRVNDSDALIQVAAADSRHISAVTVYYCTRHRLYTTVKPYLIDYEDLSDFPRTNIIPEPHTVSISDIRGLEAAFNFENNGFAVVQMESAMQYQDFDDLEKIRNVYCAEIASCLLQYFEAQEVHIFDFAVRRRHPSYPFEVVGELPTLQPATQVHVDSSYENLISLIRNLSGDKADDVLREYDCSYSNVWKPLQGPVKDWSLAICDAATVKSRDEFMATDVIGEKNLSEDLRVFHDDDHKWYYLSEQMPDELLMFRQADTDASKMGVPHTAFSHRDLDEPAYLRESIEVRALIFKTRKR